VAKEDEDRGLASWIKGLNYEITSFYIRVNVLKNEENAT
jgi:hypothetical protein